MLEVSAGCLDTVGSRQIAGRQLQPADGRPGATPVIVISERLWRGRYGARPDIIGRTIEIESSRRVVVGVVTDVLSDTPGLRFAIFGPLPTAVSAGDDTRALGVGWLKPGVRVESARAELQAVSASLDARGRPVSRDTRTALEHLLGCRPSSVMRGWP